MNLLKIEFYKLRHKKMGLMIVGISVMQFLFMIWATRGMSVHESQQGWKSCLYMFFQLNCMIMPLFIAVIASRLSDIEHKGNTFKCLKTMMPSYKIIHTKMLCGAIYLSMTVGLQLIMMLGLNGLRHFNEALPIGYLVYYGLMALLVDITLLMLQLMLSLLTTNQMIAFMAAIAGTFLGLYSMFFSEQVARWILWGYYALLAPVRMNWDPTTRIVDFYWTALPIGRIAMVIGILGVLYITGISLFTRKES